MDEATPSLATNCSIVAVVRRNLCGSAAHGAIPGRVHWHVKDLLINVAEPTLTKVPKGRTDTRHGYWLLIMRPD